MQLKTFYWNLKYVRHVLKGSYPAIFSLAVPEDRLVVGSLHKELMENWASKGENFLPQIPLFHAVLASFPFRSPPQTEILEQASDIRQTTSASTCYLLNKLQRLELEESPLR